MFKIFLPPVIWGMLRSLSVVEITPEVGLRRKWLGGVPFCLLTDISECDSTSSDFSSTSKAMVKPVPYCVNTDSQTWIKSSKRFPKVYFLLYSTIASETPQVLTWGCQTCFLPSAIYLGCALCTVYMSNKYYYRLDMNKTGGNTIYQ